MAYELKRFDQFNIGDKASFTKTVTETDVVLFAGITGDFNPIHVDDTYARTTMFGGRIVHGMFVASLIGAAGAPFCGSGSIYLGHSQRFVAPVRVGDTITAAVEVTGLVPEKKHVKMRTYCTNQDGKIVVDGEATVKIIT